MAISSVQLLDEFKQLPSHPERLPTFLEITGYPHYENACSRILAFFFDPQRPHGLGTLFLDALAQVGRIQNRETIASNVSVKCEESTRAKKRIDILIQSDSHAILIENKIYSGVDNPFDEYAKHLRSLPQEHKHKFLVTLKDSGEGADYGFRNITHRRLVKEIRGTLGNHVATADTRYLTLMLDFLNTLDNLQRGTEMDQELVDLLKSRSSEVEHFLQKMNAFKDEVRKKVKELAALIDVKHYSTVRQWLFRERESLSDTLVHTIGLASGLTVVVDTIVSPGGWEVRMFPRPGRSDPVKREELKNLLQSLDIPHKNAENNGDFIYPADLKYGVSLGQIHPVVRDVVHKLATSDGAS